MFVTAIIALWGMGVFSPSRSPSGQTASSTPATASAKPSAAEIEAAKKDLADDVRLAKQGNMITSYEFSESSATMYAGPAWYFQPVTFKKDFLASIAMLKKKIYGYQHFEIHDALSDEKVAEVTSLGSLKIYK